MPNQSFYIPAVVQLLDMSSDESSAVQPGPLVEPTPAQEGLSSFAAPDSGDEVAHEALTVSSAKAPLDTESILMQKLSDLEAELAQANGKIVDLESKQVKPLTLT